jgi:hypothetical protein
MWNYLKSKWQSLVFRLLFYFLVSLLALAVVLGISFTKRIKPHVQNEIRRYRGAPGSRDGRAAGRGVTV